MSQNRKWSWLVALAVVVGVLWFWSAGQSADPKAEKKPEEKPKKVAKAESKTAALLKKLQQPITRSNGIDANTPLKDALESFTDQFGIKFVIDTHAFKEEAKEEGGPDVETSPVKLGRMTNVPLRTALRLLLAQVPATFLVRRDFIDVTTLEAVTPERLFRRKVTAVFDKTPLEGALQELAQSSGVSVIVDGRVQEKAATPVTATLKNDVSLETAVRLLADMADLKAVRVGGALYVTTKQNAAVLLAQQEKEANENKQKLSASRIPKGDTEKPTKPEQAKPEKPR